MPITLLDGILVGFTLVSAMLAMVRGFSREVLSVVSWAAAAAAAFFFYKPVVPYLAPYIENEKVAMAAAAGVVFIIALIVVSVITMKLADWIIDSRIGALDRTLGFLYGAARGILVVAVALLFFNWLAGAKAPAWVTEAKSRPLLEQIGAKLESLLPEDPENAILKKLNPNQPAAETPAAPDAPAADAPAADAPAGGDDTNTPAPDDNDATPPANNAPAASAPAAPAN
ncbi:CvpA family protein [Mesorhizobium sp. M7A.F.Ca.US.001.01.1.1]|nr:CvpA family protein [Mesorhizobium sp. M7A.F.Ca.US.001.01.1.1]